MKQPKPVKISPELRAELDQTPAWWDKQFHKALSAVEKPVVYEVEYVEDVTFANGASRVMEGRKIQAHLDCTCPECHFGRENYG